MIEAQENNKMRGLPLKLEDTPDSVRGEFAVKVFRKGKLVDEYHDHNLVVDVGRERLANLAAGLSDKYITQIGVGEGSTVEAAGDTALTNQQLFPLTSVSVNGRDARFDFLLGEHDANGMSIREFGLFCSDDTMFSHRVRRDIETGKVGTIDKMSDLEIMGYWILHF